MRTYRTRSWRAHRPAEASLSVTVDNGGGTTTRVLGLDPGSRHTGYGIVDFNGPAATHIASGAIDTSAVEFSRRLQQIFAQVHELVVRYAPAEIAIERVFMHRNPDSALKLGQARGAALCGAFAGAVRGVRIFAARDQAGGRRFGQRRQGAGPAHGEGAPAA